MATPRTPVQRLVEKTAPAIDPIDLEDVKEYLRIDTSDFDNELRNLISSATEWIQDSTGRQFIKATWEQQLDRFPNKIQTSDLGDRREVIEIRRVPLISVNSVKYIDPDGVEQTWDSSKYDVDTVSEPARIVPVPDETFPDTETNRINAVTINMDLGYGTTQTDIPAKAKRVIIGFVAHWFNNVEPVGRGNLLPFHLQSMLESLQWDER